jgi:hypothetical protein
MMSKKTLKESYEERIKTLLYLKEANYKAYEELDKKIHEFAEWLEIRRQYHAKKGDIFEGSELNAIQEKYDELFFSIKAVCSVYQNKVNNE